MWRGASMVPQRGKSRFPAFGRQARRMLIASSLGMTDWLGKVATSVVPPREKGGAKADYCVPATAGERQASLNVHRPSKPGGWVGMTTLRQRDSEGRPLATASRPWRAGAGGAKAPPLRIHLVWQSGRGAGSLRDGTQGRRNDSANTMRKPQSFAKAAKLCATKATRLGESRGRGKPRPYEKGMEG